MPAGPAVKHYGTGRLTGDIAHRCDTYLSIGPDEAFSAVGSDLSVDVMTITPEAAALVADTALGRSAQPLRFVGYEPVSDQAAAI